MNSQIIWEFVNANKDLIQRVNLNSGTKRYYLFSGIGLRKTGFHLGHHVGLKILESLNRKGVPLIYQVANDEKQHLQGLSEEAVYQHTREILQELALYEWSDIKLIDNYRDYNLLHKIASYIGAQIPLKKILSLFGKEIDLHRAHYLTVQLAPLIIYMRIDPGATPLIITAEDQAPYFNIVRNLARRLGINPPELIILRPLRDRLLTGKMSSSFPKGAIFLRHLEALRKAISGSTDSDDFVRHLNKYLFFKGSGIKPLELSSSAQQNKTSVVRYIRGTLRGSTLLPYLLPLESKDK